MRPKSRQWIVAVFVALTLALGTAPRADGNGGFDAYYWGGHIPSWPVQKTGYVQFEIYCAFGYTCGYTNFEVDWDDGNWDSVNGYVTYSNPLEDEIFHTYGSNGLYHAHLSADDNLGNWWTATLDITITS